MWILLLLINHVVFEVVSDTEAECKAIFEVNAPYWAETKQTVRGMCVKTLRT